MTACTVFAGIVRTKNGFNDFYYLHNYAGKSLLLPDNTHLLWLEQGCIWGMGDNWVTSLNIIKYAKVTMNSCESRIKLTCAILGSINNYPSSQYLKLPCPHPPLLPTSTNIVMTSYSASCSMTSLTTHSSLMNHSWSWSYSYNFPLILHAHSRRSSISDSLDHLITGVVCILRMLPEEAMYCPHCYHQTCKQ